MLIMHQTIRYLPVVNTDRPTILRFFVTVNTDSREFTHHRWEKFEFFADTKINTKGETEGGVINVWEIVCVVNNYELSQNWPSRTWGR